MIKLNVDCRLPPTEAPNSICRRLKSFPVVNSESFSRLLSTVTLEILQSEVRKCIFGEDPLEEGMATHSSILAWRIPMDRGARSEEAHV